VKRQVRAPLLVTGCSCCRRRRACVFLPLLSGYKHPLCRQCIRALMPRLTAALAYFQAQGR